MTALWFAAAAVLTVAGLLLVALARPRTRRAGPESHAEPRTHPPEGGNTDPPTPGLFTPAVEPTPNPPTHWHSPEDPT